jgi:DNA invertase Pin-like site-specific DNA recombinase
MTPEQIEQIVIMRNSGFTLTQVAELFNTDRLTIRKVESNYYKEKRANEGAR